MFYIFRRPSRAEAVSNNSAYITLSPSEFEIKNGVRNIIYGFEHIVGT